MQGSLPGQGRPLGTTFYRDQTETETMKDENDAIPEDTVQIPRVCGACYYWKPNPVQTPVPQADNQAIDGLCYFNPPGAFPATQNHPLTQKPILGTVSVRPGVTSAEPACGQWCPSNMDPFADYDTEVDVN